MSAASPEAPLWVEINSRRRTCWTCTPVDLEPLVLGYLLSSGYIGARADVVQLEIVAEPAGCCGVRVSVAADAVVRVAREQKQMREDGCGLLHYVTCEPEVLRSAARTVAPPSPESLRDAFRALFAATDAAYPEGGMHGAALLHGERIVATAFDVGRHNVMDRVLGLALLQGVPPGEAGVLLSARVSGAIALKAARGGVAWLASRSIPTTLAQQVADAGGLPLLARAGRGGSREEPA